MGNETKRIAVITHEPIPIGGAATNRILSWTKAIADENTLVKIFIFKPTESKKNVCNNNFKGAVGSVEFEYIHQTTIWPDKKNKLYKIWILITALFKLKKSLIKFQPDTIVTYTLYYYIKLYLFFLKRKLKFRYIIEETEYPKILKTTKNKFIQKKHLDLYKKADGVLAMTQQLKKYFIHLGCKECFVLPMSVDTSRFEGDFVISKKPYFIYLGGSGGFERDGVSDIIKAFSNFVINYSIYKLFIVGPVNQKIIEKIYCDINNDFIKKQIIFLGNKPSSEVPALLMEATGIIMAPPHDYLSGGFPTKLGEFLASGTPVICTKVSDIPEYLNETNSFLSEPKNIEGLINAMENLVENAKTATNIGLQGKQVAQTVFNAATYSKELRNYLIKA